jgi:hypothetical protein
MRDLLRDWRRWTAAERAFAVTLTAVTCAALPLLLALDSLR